jgi:hypothetical protein
LQDTAADLVWKDDRTLATVVHKGMVVALEEPRGSESNGPAADNSAANGAPKRGASCSASGAGDNRRVGREVWGKSGVFSRLPPKRLLPPPPRGGEAAASAAGGGVSRWVGTGCYLHRAAMTCASLAANTGSQ